MAWKEGVFYDFNRVMNLFYLHAIRQSISSISIDYLIMFTIKIGIMFTSVLSCSHFFFRRSFSVGCYILDRFRFLYGGRFQKSGFKHRFQNPDREIAPAFDSDVVLDFFS